MEFDEVVVIYKRYIEPFIAIFVVLGLIYSMVMLYENYQAKKEVSESCGWEGEDFRCTCEKGDVIAAENRMRGEMGEVIWNVSLVE